MCSNVLVVQLYNCNNYVFHLSIFHCNSSCCRLRSFKTLSYFLGHVVAPMKLVSAALPLCSQTGAGQTKLYWICPHSLTTIASNRGDFWVACRTNAQLSPVRCDSVLPIMQDRCHSKPGAAAPLRFEAFQTTSSGIEPAPNSGD